MASVLVVNSYDSREMYAEYLQAHDFAVRAVATPEEALATITAFTPDVIVTDFAFEGSSLDGPSFIGLLRTQRGLQTTPVIVVSGYVREEDRQQARAAGADLFLSSPCLPEHLLNEIRGVLAFRGEGRRMTWNWPPPSSAADRPLVERRRRVANHAKAINSDVTERIVNGETPDRELIARGV